MIALSDDRTGSDESPERVSGTSFASEVTAGRPAQPNPSLFSRLPRLPKPIPALAPNHRFRCDRQQATGGTAAGGTTAGAGGRRANTVRLRPPLRCRPTLSFGVILFAALPFCRCPLPLCRCRFAAAALIARTAWPFGRCGETGGQFGVTVATGQFQLFLA